MQNSMQNSKTLDLPPTGIGNALAESDRETLMIFSVPKMNCGHCASAIKAGINTKDPSAVVATDLDLRLITVQSTLEQVAVREAIVEAGYDVAPV